MRNHPLPDNISGINRRDFLKFCGMITAVLGYGASYAGRLAAALATGPKPKVIWLHFAECTGCSESFLRASNPWVGDILLDIIDLVYHETLMYGGTNTIEQQLYPATDTHAGQFIMVAEGSVPTAENGAYGIIGSKTMLQIAKDICPKAKSLITFGNCSSFGGVAAAAPNPTGAKGVLEAVPELCIPVVKMPGCAPNPINLIALLADYLLKGAFPDRDMYGRPLFAYGKPVHKRCPYRKSGDGDPNMCSDDIGCKGMVCMNNCPTAMFNDESHPLQVGHPCIGCSEPQFWDRLSPFYDAYPGGKHAEYEFDSSWKIPDCNLTKVEPQPPDKAPARTGRLFNIKGQRSTARGRRNMGTVRFKERVKNNREEDSLWQE